MKPYLSLLYIVAAAILTACNSSNAAPQSGAELKHEHQEGHDHDLDHDGEDNHDHDHDGDRAEKKSASANEIHFSCRQAEAVGLQVEEVAPASFNYVIKTSGQILSAQGDEATIAATANGIVSFAGSAFTEGASVRAGECIVRISAKNLPDGDPATKAKIAYESAQKEHRRAEKLVKDQIISNKEYEQTCRDYQTAKTIYEAQASGTGAGGVSVASPMSGYIKNRMVNQGEYVSVGQPIATVSQNRRLQLRAEVSESHFKNVRNVSGANFQTSYDNKLYELSDLNGRLLSFGRASTQSSYIPVTFEFDNVGDVVPGSFVTVYLLSNTQEEVLSVPVSAITEEQGLHFVYLRLAEEEYQKQEVTLGQSNGRRVRILSGLKSGDNVVTHGVYQVKLAAISSVMPEGHTH